MKYLKYTKIDSVTGISANIQTPRNGETDPNISGLEVVFSRCKHYGILVCNSKR